MLFTWFTLRRARLLVNVDLIVMVSQHSVSTVLAGQSVRTYVLGKFHSPGLEFVLWRCNIMLFIYLFVY